MQWHVNDILFLQLQKLASFNLHHHDGAFVYHTDLSLRVCANTLIKKIHVNDIDIEFLCKVTNP